MVSSVSSTQFNLTHDKAARLIQKNYKNSRDTKANSASSENVRMPSRASAVDLAHIHPVESPLPLTQSSPGLLEPTNESLLSALTLNPQPPLYLQQDFNDAVFTGCSLETFNNFINEFRTVSGNSNDHSVEKFMTEIYYGSIDVNDFFSDPDLKQKINTAADWLGIRNIGFVHIFRSATTIDELKNKLLFEKNFGTTQKMKSEIHLLGFLLKKLITENDNLRQATSKSNKKNSSSLLSSMEISTLDNIIPLMKSRISQQIKTLLNNIEQLTDYGCSAITLFNQQIVFQLRDRYSSFFADGNNVPQPRNKSKGDKIISNSVMNFPFLAKLQDLPEYEELNKNVNDLNELLYFNEFNEIAGWPVLLISDMDALKFGLDYFKNQTHSHGHIQGRIADMLAEIDEHVSKAGELRRVYVEPYPDMDVAEQLWDLDKSSFAQVYMQENQQRNTVRRVLDFFRDNNLPGKDYSVVIARLDSASSILSAMNRLDEQSSEMANKDNQIVDQIAGSLMAEIFKDYADFCEKELLRELGQETKKNTSKKIAKKPKIAKSKNQSKINIQLPIKKSQADLVKNFLIDIANKFNALSVESDTTPWINKTHFDAIKKFSMQRSSASHIVPPGKDSSICALVSDNNPLLSNIKIFPSRAIGSGESIDQHVRRRHPQFFSQVCKNESDQLNNIRALSEVAMSVLNDIESTTESDEFNIPHENITIRVPTLLVEGQFNGQKVRVALSKPLNKLLGLNVFDSAACLVVRSIYPVQDINQAQQLSFS